MIERGERIWNTWNGQEFSITDPKDANTVVYMIHQTEEEYKEASPEFTVERLEYTEEAVGDKKRKIFYIEEEFEKPKDLVLFTFANNKVVVNMGRVEEDHVKISKEPVPIKYNTIYNEEETEYRDFDYTPNLRRPISIIDPETGEEVKPSLYLDEESNKIKGKCRLKPYKSYLAFEVVKGKEDEK